MRIINLLVFIAFLILNACTSSKKIKDGKILVNENGEARLGKSKLYIILPKDLEMHEVNGKEGYYGYNIFSKDSVYNITGEMVIWNGHPIVSAFGESKITIDSVTNKILGNPITWTIYKTDKGLYATSKSEYGFFIWAKERKDVDRMIEVFSSLKKK